MTSFAQISYKELLIETRVFVPKIFSTEMRAFNRHISFVAKNEKGAKQKKETYPIAKVMTQFPIPTNSKPRK